MTDEQLIAELTRRLDERKAKFIDADPRIVAAVLSTDVDADDGRTRWQWMRFGGDLLLVCYPMGSTYEMARDSIREK